MTNTALGWSGWVICSAVLLLWTLSGRVGAQQGYRIVGNQILVEGKSHWEAWKVAGGIVDMARDGSVRPSFVRKNINAALDAQQFSITGPGGILVGSNQPDAGHLVDGDRSTTWGPEKDSPLEDWWVQLSLGRVVVASKIVLRFAAAADPFLQFKVLVWRHGPSRAWSDRDYTLKGTDIPNFWEIGRTIKPNKNQRVFEFVPLTTQESDNGFTGDPIEFVQIIATDSDFDKAQEVTKAEYEALPEDRKGAVEYYRRKLSSEQILISKDEYEGFDDPELRGAVIYYRREVPELAEIEVWTVGDNLNLGTVERGGQLTVETNAGPQNMGSILTDGDYTTGHNGTVFSHTVYRFFEDLGAVFWVDTMHFINDGVFALGKLAVDISDGTRAPDGSIKWTRIGSREGEAGQRGLRFRQFRIDPAKVRFIRAPFSQGSCAECYYVGFTEVMLYGEGYVPEVVLASNLIRLGGSKNLISITWEADTPPGTSVQVQTRTGNELEEVKTYHDSQGQVISERKYSKLPKQKKGDIRSAITPSGGWSPWSSSYTVPGADILSPSPREFILIRAVILSDHPAKAASLRSIAVKLSEPLADRMVGEVWPTRIGTTGRSEKFSFFIRPSFGNSKQAFDEIGIQTFAGSTVDLLEVRLGSDDDFHSGQAKSLRPAELVLLEAPAGALCFRLPFPVQMGVDLIEMRFRSTIFSNSASFSASVQNSASPGFRQRVDAGDATDLVDSQVTTALALGANEVIMDFDIEALVVTPNGDGVHDEMRFNFGIARINAEKAVALKIYDLSGGMIKEFVERRPDPRGSYAFVWTGEDRSGRVVPPGIYLARLEIETDSGSVAETLITRLIYVAY